MTDESYYYDTEEDCEVLPSSSSSEEEQSSLMDKVNSLVKQISYKQKCTDYVSFTYLWDKKFPSSLIDIGDNIPFKQFLQSNKFSIRDPNCASILKKNVAGECSICYHHYDDMISLSCNHVICKNCVIAMISSSVSDYSFPFLQCQGVSCKNMFHPYDIEEIISCDQALLDKFRKRLEEFIIKNSLSFTSCYKCGKLLVETSADPETMTAFCEDHGYTCVLCGNKSHYPCKCVHVARWTVLCGDDYLNSIYYKVYTKSCPSCSETIEKNNGCNHMVCKCGYEFCWICLKNWKEHPKNFYECSFGVSKSISRGAALSKFVDFFKDSRQYAETYENIEFQDDKIQNLLNLSSTGLDYYTSVTASSMLKKHIRELIDNILFLQWTYPFSYFVDISDAERNIFAEMQLSAQYKIDRLMDLFSGNNFRVDLVFNTMDDLNKVLRYINNNVKQYLPKLREDVKMD